MPGTKHKRNVGVMGLVAATMLAAGASGQVSKNVVFFPPTPYLSPSDSPFFGDGLSCHALENFQTGQVSAPGLTVVQNAGAAIVSPGGVVDPGNPQYALSGTNSVGVLQLNFSSEVLGQFPTRAGFVWTRGFNGFITLTVVNSRGRVSSQVHAVNSPNLPGNPADDLFFGVRSDVGISSLMISFNPPIFCEIDHVQFSLPSVDSDKDGAFDCVDACPNDPQNRCRVRGDVNGDGIPDVFVQNTGNHGISLWMLAADGSVAASREVGNPGTGVAPVGFADFGADGSRELLLQNASARQLSLWPLGGADGATPVRVESVLSPNGQPFAPTSNWIVQGTADFDGDGQVDILARDTGTGVMNVWRVVGRTVVSTHSLASVPSNPAWIIGGVIEGPTPGTTRIVAQNRVNRRIIVWNVNGFSPSGSTFVTGAGGTPVQLPVGSSLVGLRRFTGETGPSLLVRSNAGKIDRWQLDAQNRYLRGSGVTPDNRPAFLPRPD